MLRPAEGRYVDGYRIRDLRKSQKLSQAALATRAGLSAETVKRLERSSVSNAEVTTVAALARSLGVSIDRLLV